MNHSILILGIAAHLEEQGWTVQADYESDGNQFLSVLDKPNSLILINSQTIIDLDLHETTLSITKYPYKKEERLNLDLNDPTSLDKLDDIIHTHFNRCRLTPNYSTPSPSTSKDSATPSNSTWDQATSLDPSSSPHTKIATSPESLTST